MNNSVALYSGLCQHRKQCVNVAPLIAFGQIRVHGQAYDLASGRCAVEATQTRVGQLLVDWDWKVHAGRDTAGFGLDLTITAVLDQYGALRKDAGTVNLTKREGLATLPC